MRGSHLTIYADDEVCDRAAEALAGWSTARPREDREILALKKEVRATKRAECCGG